MKRLAIALSLFLAASAFSQTVRLVQWDAMDDAAYFRVFLGTNSGSYTTNYTVTNSTSFTNSYASGTYFVAVKAGDTNGLESGFSAEVKFTIFPAPRIRVTLQSKRNLDDPWMDRLNTVEMVSTPGDQFFRTKLDIIR